MQLKREANACREGVEFLIHNGFSISIVAVGAEEGCQRCFGEEGDSVVAYVQTEPQLERVDKPPEPFVLGRSHREFVGIETMAEEV